MTLDKISSSHFIEFNTERLKQLITSHEDWLLQRLTRYVVDRGFGKYVPPLIESWRLAVSGVSESILIGLTELHPAFELGPDDDHTVDPVSRFAVLEAHRHRERGVTLNMFLGLLIYFRQIFLDLIRFADFDREYERDCHTIIERLFDRMLIAISMEWTNYDQRELIEDLQANNRLMTNEKNKYLSLFESHPHLVFILDKDHRIDNMNHSAATLLKKAKLPGSQYYRVVQEGETTLPVLRVSRESAAENHFEKVTSDDLFPWLADDLKDYAESTDLLRAFEKKVEMDQDVQYFNVKLSRTIDAREEIRGIILVIEDITSQKMVSEELRAAKEKAESANRAKSAFLASMSHELRTPLNAILGFANQMTKAPDLSSEHLKYLGIISNSGENLLNLINNVLDISKIEAGHLVREDMDINLGHLLNEIHALMSLKISEKGLDFHVSKSPELPQDVTLDAGKLRQVLTNLIANAIKYTETGAISLKVTVAAWESPGLAWLRFEVADTGIGIRPEDTEIIFTPFEQIAGQPNSESGTGLGLTICKQYTEVMGGRIGVQSKMETGSVFHLEIPAIVRAASPISQDQPPYDRAAGIVPGQPSYRILIAEDDPESRLLLVKLLEPFGFELREAVNGREAVDLFEQWRPHLIWMDIRMPVMSGLQAARRIKSTQHGQKTKVAALTAHALEEERLEILAAGCDAFIRKPYRESEILDALAKLLGVKFLYSDNEKAVPQGREVGLDPERMMKVPSNLTDDLQKAAVLLDEKHCLKTIGIIGAHDPPLGSCLHRMVKDFQYNEILVALDNLTGKRRI